MSIDVPYEVCGFGPSGNVCQAVPYQILGTVSADRRTIEGRYGTTPFAQTSATFRRE